MVEEGRSDRLLWGGPQVYPPIVAMGGSFGALCAFRQILADLLAEFPAPVIVLRHDSRPDLGFLPDLLRARCPLPVELIRHGDHPRPGVVFLTPGGHHLTFAPDCRFLLHDVTRVGRINFVCPCINLLFCSMADIFADRAIAVVLSGGGTDGAMGCRAVLARSGVVIAETEDSARCSGMPTAAVDLAGVDLILPASKIGFAFECLAVDDFRDRGKPLKAVPSYHFTCPDIRSLGV